MRVNRILAIAFAALAALLGGRLAIGDATSAASGASSGPLALRVGDSVRVVDAPIGCRVVRMRQLGGRIVVDCRRAGSLVGTYGTLLTAHEAALVRFEPERRARLLMVATHDGRLRRCEPQR